MLSFVENCLFLIQQADYDDLLNAYLNEKLLQWNRHRFCIGETFPNCVSSYVLSRHGFELLQSHTSHIGMAFHRCVVLCAMSSALVV